MLISPAQLRRYWALNPQTILHVGAHHAEELEQYELCGWGTQSVIWVEALSSAADAARQRVRNREHHIVIEAVAWSTAGQAIRFHEAINGQSSSVFEFGTHSDHYPDIRSLSDVTMTTATLSELLNAVSAPRMEFINLDIQGAELEALKGLGEWMNDAHAIYSEVNLEEVYKGCVLLDDLDAWLHQQGFRRVDIQLTDSGWGDALWLRRHQVPPLSGFRRILRRSEALLFRANASIRYRLRLG